MIEDPSRQGAVESPRPGLEHQVVGALVGRGLIVPTRVAVRGQIVRGTGFVIAAVALFGAGMWFGRPAHSPVPADTPKFLLLLYEDSSFIRSPDGPAAQAAEYGRWAHQTFAGGHVSGGAELGDSAMRLEPDGNGAQIVSADLLGGRERLAGYFLVEAASYDAAVAIARTCPHLRYGGTIVIREMTG